jgi:hypothetical protein
MLTSVATDFEQAWAVMCRDTGVLDGDRLNVVEVLRVYLAEDAALAEVDRLRAQDADQDHFYYYAATQVALG